MGHEKDWHLLNWYCPSLCKVKSFLLWRQFPRSPNLSICSFVDILHQRDPVFIFEQIFSGLSSRPSSSRPFSHPTRMSEVVKLSVSAKALKILVKHVLANSRQMHQFCTYMQNCYKKRRVATTYQQKGNKLQKIYLCTLVEATKIGNKKMKKCPQSV